MRKLDAAVAKFIEAQRTDGYSANTIRARANCIKAIAKHAGVPARNMRVSHVASYFATKALSSWTRRTYLNHLAAFGKWLGVDLIEGIRKPPAPRAIPHPIAEADLVTLLGHTRNGAQRSWVLLGAYCGLRAHETAKLRVGDFEDIGDGETVLRILGKGGRTDVVPVPPVVLGSLDRSGTGRFWPDLRPERVSRTVSKLAAGANITMRYHQLRHRFGTAIYRASGQDLLLTQRLMRHASPATTAGYAAVADDRIHEVCRGLPGALLSEV
jgi:integrase